MSYRISYLVLPLAVMLVPVIVIGADVKKDPPVVLASQLKDAKCPVNKTLGAKLEHAVDYKSGRVFLSTADAAKSFAADPKKYEAWANYQLVFTKQYEQQTCPLSGEEFDEDSATVMIAGVEVGVLCGECAKGITKDPIPEQIELIFDAEGFEFGKFVLRERESVVDSVEASDS